VTITSIWNSRTKFIEFHAPDDKLAADLDHHGFTRYLAVVPEPGTSTQAAPSTARQKTARVAGTLPVGQNNADVLVLSGIAALFIWRFRQFRHVCHVAIRPTGWITTCLAAFGCIIQVLLGRLRWRGLHVFQGAERKQYLFIFGVRRRKALAAVRWYVPHELGVSGFFNTLQSGNVRYAVLRWFQDLPALPPGEDLDMLVDDQDLTAVHTLLDSGPGLQPCDVYSVTGLPSSEYRGLPYFPPQLAATLLDHVQLHPSQALVPSTEHHFLSLAYHAVYHKGRKSGLPSRNGHWNRWPNPEHDYVNILRSLATQLDINLELTHEGVDQCLQIAGWRPPRDMLVRLASKRRDLSHLLGKSSPTDEDPGLAVFLIREAAAQPQSLACLIEEIERQGFQILKTKVLSAFESQAVSRTIRGGNWGRGPWAACGGLPAAAVVAYDSEPIPVSRSTRRRFPQLTNARLLCKSKLRESFNQTLPPEMHVNALHSSDNGHEALEYLRVVMPADLAAIQAQIAHIRSSFATREPVLFQLSAFRRRAKTEVIRFGEQLAVKKTFKSHQRSYCQREAWAMSQLSRTVSAIPPLLASDGESVIYPYYDDVLKFRRSSGRLLPLAVAKQAIAALRQVYDAGYALIDAHPENVIVDRQHGLKLIDFEFLHEYENKPTTFEQSYDIAGCPENFSGSQPDGGAKCYARHWRPYIGLSLHSLLHDPTWLQQTKRALYIVVSLPRLFPRRLRELALNAWHSIWHDRADVFTPPVHDQQPDSSQPKRIAA